MHLRFAALTAISGVVFGQVFEVATVKPSPPPQSDRININLGTAQNGRVALTNATLSDCIKFAYGIVSDSQLVGPAWIKSARFDIVGQAPPSTSRDQLLRMLQSLLKERLKLVLHNEQRELPHLVLSVARGGPKLRPATEAEPAAGAQVRGRIVSTRMPMSVLVLLLSRFEQQTILDQTGLEGMYEIKLEWTPDRLAAPTGAAGPPPETPSGPSIFAAIQEQLGLRLESRRGPIDILVVDSAERTPADN